MQKITVLVIGCKRAGKTTFALEASKILNKPVFNLADKLKEITNNYFCDINPYYYDNKDQIIPSYGKTYRELLIKMSKNVKSMDPLYFVKVILNKLTNVTGTGGIVGDVRYFYEFEKISKEFKSIVVYIKNDKAEKNRGFDESENDFLKIIDHSTIIIENNDDLASFIEKTKKACEIIKQIETVQITQTNKIIL